MQVQSEIGSLESDSKHKQAEYMGFVKFNDK